MDLVTISEELCEAVEGMEFPAPITHVYNPLKYCRASHELYLSRYGAESPREVLMFGMNPGPWGMAQTGIPFGHIGYVKDWLQIEAPVQKPAHEHPKRPVEGFACKRREVSGARLWGWIAERFGTPEAFFSQFFITNYCPLSFMEENGRNRTPDKLPIKKRNELFAPCDRALRQTVEVLQPTYVVGIGAFAERRAQAALAGMDVQIGRVLHPSPASPIAAHGWDQKAEAALRKIGISLPDQEPA